MPAGTFMPLGGAELCGGSFGGEFLWVTHPYALDLSCCVSRASLWHWILLKSIGNQKMPRHPKERKIPLSFKRWSESAETPKAPKSFIMLGRRSGWWKFSHPQMCLFSRSLHPCSSVRCRLLFCPVNNALLATALAAGQALSADTADSLVTKHCKDTRRILTTY